MKGLMEKKIFYVHGFYIRGFYIRGFYVRGFCWSLQVWPSALQTVLPVRAG